MGRPASSRTTTSRRRALRTRFQSSLLTEIGRSMRTEAFAWTLTGGGGGCDAAAMSNSIAEHCAAAR